MTQPITIPLIDFGKIEYTEDSMPDSLYFEKGYLRVIGENAYSRPNEEDEMLGREDVRLDYDLTIFKNHITSIRRVYNPENDYYVVYIDDYSELTINYKFNQKSKAQEFYEKVLDWYNAE